MVCSVCFPGLPTLDLLPKTRDLPACAIWLTFFCTSLKAAACQENHPLFPPGTILWDFPGGATGKEHVCQCRWGKRGGFNLWVRKITWRRAWQPTPVFLPGKSLDRGAWGVTVHRVTKSQTQLKQLCMYTHSYIKWKAIGEVIILLLYFPYHF